jgi:hypothetical protein
MSLKNMTLKTGASAVAPTGGTDMVYADDGVTIQNGLHLIVPATADYSLREQCTAKFRPPVLQADGSYTKDKKTMSLAFPFVLASGKTVYSVVRCEIEVHPEVPSADALDYKYLGAQAFSSDDTANFWAVGSMT